MRVLHHSTFVLYNVNSLLKSRSSYHDFEILPSNLPILSLYKPEQKGTPCCAILSHYVPNRRNEMVHYVYFEQFW